MSTWYYTQVPRIIGRGYFAKIPTPSWKKGQIGKKNIFSENKGQIGFLGK